MAVILGNYPQLCTFSLLQAYVTNALYYETNKSSFVIYQNDVLTSTNEYEQY